MARIPNIFEQLFVAGDTVLGGAYGGSPAPVQSADGHVYRQTRIPGDGAIDGGFIPTEATGGHAHYRVATAVYVFVSDATEIRVVAVDPDGYEFILYTQTGGECLIIGEDIRYPIYPTWTVKIEADTSNGGNAVGVDGAKIVIVVDPWFQPAAFNMA